MSGRLAGAAYGEPTDPKRRSAAASFRHDPQLEEVARAEAGSGRTSRRVSPTLKASLGYYLSAKAAAEAEGLDTGGWRHERRPGQASREAERLAAKAAGRPHDAGFGGAIVFPPRVSLSDASGRTVGGSNVKFR